MGSNAALLELFPTAFRVLYINLHDTAGFITGYSEMCLVNMSCLISASCNYQRMLNVISTSSLQEFELTMVKASIIIAGLDLQATERRLTAHIGHL